MNTDNGQKLENKIMSQIKSGRVRLRSRYIFLAEKLGLSSAFALRAMLAVFIFNLALFYMKETDSLGYLSFGRSGSLAFLESFPYLLVVSFILFLFLAGYMLSKSDYSYKKPFSYLAIGLIAFVMIAGAVLAYTDIPRQIEAKAFADGQMGRFFRPFLESGLARREHGLAGIISEVGTDYLLVETPQGVKKISLEKFPQTNFPQFKKEQFIMAIGRWQGDIFLAENIRLAGQDGPPMIRRGIHRRSRPLSADRLNVTSTPNFLDFNNQKSPCGQKCLESDENPEPCFANCHR